jgi:diamine N-acetyltransferase
MVWLKVLEPNTAGVRAYQRAGFRMAGRLRQAGYWLGQPCDELFMDATPDDLEGSVIATQHPTSAQHENEQTT